MSARQQASAGLMTRAGCPRQSMCSSLPSMGTFWSRGISVRRDWSCSLSHEPIRGVCDDAASTSHRHVGSGQSERQRGTAQAHTDSRRLWATWNPGMTGGRMRCRRACPQKNMKGTASTRGASGVRLRRMIGYNGANGAIVLHTRVMP